MPRIVWAETARAELRSINDYLFRDDPATAVRILKAIRARAEQLRTFPESGPVLRGELHSLVVTGTPYRIVYMAGEGRIAIVHVRHARQNWRAG